MVQEKLIRHFGFWTLLIYGVGDILGAGIYALIGKVAGVALGYSWISFLFAMGVAFFTALGYAELSGKFPKSGGVAHFSEVAFNKKWLSFMAGWLLICTSLFSMATIAHSFVGYFQSFNDSLPRWFLILIFLI